MIHSYFVYMVASRRNGTLYIGVTNDLSRRVWEHKEGLIDGFTKKYNVKMLVHYEEFGNIQDAILREKTLKEWMRLLKLRLVEEHNPEWRDLYEDLV